MAPPLFTTALSTLSNDVGLTVPGDASGTTSESSTFGNGLVYPNFNYNSPNNFNTISTTQLTPGAAQKPLPVDYNREAESALGKDNIDQYVNELINNKDPNIAFQDLVNKAVGQTFQTPGAMNPKMREIIDNFYNRVTTKANEHIRQPNDKYKRNALAQELMNMGNVIKPRVVPVQADVQADAVPGGQTQSAPPQAQGWLSNLKLWGGRKTARNHSRSHKRSRSRSRKQYKKLKRSSRSRRRC